MSKQKNKKKNGTQTHKNNTTAPKKPHESCPENADTKEELNKTETPPDTDKPDVTAAQSTQNEAGHDRREEAGKETADDNTQAQESLTSDTPQKNNVRQQKPYVYKPKGRARHIRRRITPLERLLRTVIAAAACVLVIYLLLVNVFGFQITQTELTYTNGKTVTVHYLGFMSDGEATKGSVAYSDGRRAMIENRRVTYNDGTVYTGTLDGYIKSGIGTLKFPNGDVFTGEFKNDEIWGQGKFVYYATGDIYEGIIINGKKEQRGTYTYFDTNVYKGEYKNDLPNGNGTLYFYDGGVYEGNFVDGTRQGKGKYIFPSGDVYEGDFVDGKACGKGVYKFACGDVYEGEFSDGKINGKGKYTWADGRDYEGTFKNGIAVYERD